MGAVVNNNADSYGEWTSTWDNENIYFFFDIFDNDPINSKEGTQPWFNDGVELFIDLQDRRFVGMDRIESEQHQFHFNYGTTGPAHGDNGDGVVLGMPAWFGDNDTTNIVYAINITGYGYTIEAAIPWNTLLRTSSNTNVEAMALVADSIYLNKNIAVEVGLIDAVAIDTRKSLLSWSNNTGEDKSNFTNEYWGQATLVKDIQTPIEVSIYDIQYADDSIIGNSPFVDSVVNTTGIVTGIDSYGYFIQNGKGAWNGIYIYQPEHETIETGQEISVIGLVKEYNKLTEIEAYSFELLSSGNLLPTSTIISFNEYEYGEAYESVLVTIENITAIDIANVYGEWVVTDALSNEMKIDDKIFGYLPYAGEKFKSLTGCLDYSFGEFKLLPRSNDDIVKEIGNNVLVVFNVNMFNAIDDGSFNANTDEVYVTGSFNEWKEPGLDGTILLKASGNNVFSGSIQVDANLGIMEYKYFINTGWDNGDPYNEGANRSATIGETDLTISDQFGNLSTEVPNSYIGKKDFSIYINGDASEWAKVPGNNINKPFIGESPSLNSAVWKAVWDDDGIYVAVEVDDNIWMPSWLSGDFDYFSDKVELYFDVSDPLKDGGGVVSNSTSGLPGNYQVAPDFSIDTQGQSKEYIGNNFVEGSGVLYADTYDGEGTYTIEYFVPYAAIPVNFEGIIIDPKVTTQIGFDVTVSDRDAPSEGRNRMVWSNVGGIAESWANMDDVGRITFSNGTTGNPIIVSIDVVSTTENSATIQAVVNPNGLETDLIFLYGTSPTNLIGMYPSPSNINGNTDVTVTAELTGLGGSRYYYKIAAVNSLGIKVESELKDFSLCDDNEVIITGSTSLCGGATNVLYSVDEVPGATYEWNVAGGNITSGAGTKNIYVDWNTGISQGEVSIVITPNDGCVKTGSLIVNFSGSASVGKPIIRKKGAINILICTTPEMNGYQWYKNGKALADGNKQFYVAKNNYGDYQIKITDAGGCVISSDVFSVTSNKSLQIYPNPASETATINYNAQETGSVTIQIIDVFGKTINSIVYNKEEYQLTKDISLNGLEKGVYMIEISIGNEKIESQQFIKN